MPAFPMPDLARAPRILAHAGHRLDALRPGAGRPA